MSATLAQALADAARRHSDRPAVAEGSRCLDYAAFLDLVRRLAARLARHGVGSGDVIMVALRNTLEHLAAWFAIQWLGGVALPVDHRLAAADLDAIARAMSARAALVDSPLDLGMPCIDVGALNYEQPIGHSPLALRDGAAFLGLSSGTTGSQKAAVLTHEQIMARNMVFQRHLFGGTPDRFLCVLPLAFGYARAAIARLVNGDFVALLPPPHDAAAIRRAIEEHAITSVAVTPNMLEDFARLPGEPPLLPGIRCLQVGAATLSGEQRAAARARISPHLYEAYATAIGGIITIAKPADQIRAPAAVGRPVNDVEIEIVDDDHRVLARGEIGLIRFRGPGCATRIVGGDDIADERIQDGWVYPGDVGALTPDGDLMLHGRTSEMIKRGAVTVFAPEIERFLRGHEAVADAAVIGRAAAATGEDIVAFVVLRDPDALESVMLHCRRNLIGYKRPQRVIAVDALPRNSAGKVTKRELARLLT